MRTRRWEKARQSPKPTPTACDMKPTIPTRSCGIRKPEILRTDGVADLPRIVPGEFPGAPLTLVAEAKDVQVFTTKSGEYLLDHGQLFDTRTDAQGNYTVTRRRIRVSRAEALRHLLAVIIPEQFKDLIQPALAACDAAEFRAMQLPRRLRSKQAA